MKLIKDTFIYGGGDFVGRLITFITFPIIAAVLSPKDYGSIELIVTSIVLLGYIANSGLNNAVQRYYWDELVSEKERPVIVSTGLVTLTVFGLVLAGILLLASPFLVSYLESNNYSFGYIAVVSACMLIVLQQNNQYIIDVTRLHFAPYKYLVLTNLKKTGTALLGLLFVVYLDKGIDGYIGVQAATLIVLLPIGIYLIKRDITLEFDKKWFKKLVSFGYPFIFVSIAYWLFGSMDRWMLAALSSVEETGIYSISFRFSGIALFVSVAFGQAWSPYAMKIKTDQPDNYKKIYTKVLYVLLLVMFLIGGGLAMLSGEILYLFMPSDYYASALPMSILCFGIVFKSTQQVTALGISLEEKTYWFARIAWITAGFNLIANWFLIPPLGALGAAIATAVSYLLITVLYLYYTQQLHPLPLSKMKLLILLSLGCVLLWISIKYLHVGFDPYVVAVKLIGLVVIISVTFFMLNLKLNLNFSKIFKKNDQ